MKTVVHNCPKCGEANCFNVKESIAERQVKWFICTFCGKRSNKQDWK